MYSRYHIVPNAFKSSQLTPGTLLNTTDSVQQQGAGAGHPRSRSQSPPRAR